MASVHRQDMAPRGGYPAINYARNIPKQRFPAWTVALGGVAISAFGFALMVKSNRAKRRDVKEQLTGRLHLLPLLQAEEDRRVLRAMKTFEEEEALIMKDVRGWQVGKSVYHTDKWMPPYTGQLKETDSLTTPTT